MNINSIGAGNQVQYASQAAGGGAQGVRREPPPPPPPPDGGDFISAIADTLKSLGTGAASGAARAETAGNADNAAQALGSFLEELMSGLHAQHSAAGAPPPYGEQGPGPGKLADDLQSLIAGDTSGSSLETSFQNLLEALGSDSSEAGSQLKGFLQALADKLPGAGSSGNLVNTTA